MMINSTRISALRHGHALVNRIHSTCSFSTKQLIVNAVGCDRLGIVSDMTKQVIDVGGNVGASQASRLGSHFSLMMLVNVPVDKVDTLTGQLSKMQDLSASVHMVKEEEATLAVPKIGYRARFTLEGADHPGIVHKVTSMLAKSGLNIDKMETSDDIAPHGGTILFKMVGLAHAYEPMASGFDPNKIRETLTSLGDELNCDIELTDIDKDEWKGFHAA